MGKHGIENIKIVVDAVRRIATTIEKAWEDEKINIKDLPLIFPFLKSLHDLRHALPHLKQEYQDLSDAERLLLQQHIQKQDPQANPEMVVNTAIDLAMLILNSTEQIASQAQTLLKMLK